MHGSTSSQLASDARAGLTGSHKGLFSSLLHEVGQVPASRGAANAGGSRPRRATMPTSSAPRGSQPGPSPGTSTREVSVSTTAVRMDIDTLAINTIRGLCMDKVQKANSGHPGTPMGIAPVAYTLWQRFLRFDPADPIWPNPDRFVLSEGHALALLWSLLHLSRVQAVPGSLGQCNSEPVASRSTSGTRPRARRADPVPSGAAHLRPDHRRLGAARAVADQVSASLPTGWPKWHASAWPLHDAEGRRTEPRTSTAQKGDQ